MKKIAILCFAVSGIAMFRVPCAAGEVTFPNAGGDLASGWGELSPSSSDTVVISQGGTYTAAGQDVSFENIKVTTGDKVTFSLPSSRKVTLNNKLTAYTIQYAITYGYGFAPIYGGNIDITFDGGIWHMANNSSFYAASSLQGYNNFGGNVTISGGAIITNVYRFYYGEHSRNNTVTIDNSKVYTRLVENWATGDHNLLDICNSGEMVVSSQLISDNSGTPSATTGYNTIQVRGSGSKLKLTGSNRSFVGYTHRNQTLRVTDYASFDTSAELRIGGGATGSNALFTVENCATATVANLCLYGAASGARVVVSNATLNVDKFNMPNVNESAGKKVSVIDGGNLNVTSTFAASNGLFSVENRATATVTNLCLYGGTPDMHVVVSNATLNVDTFNVKNSDESAFNRISIIDGGRLHIISATTNSMTLGTALNGTASNRLEVLNGSVVDVGGADTLLTIGGKGSFNEAIVRESCVTCGYVRVGSDAKSTGNRFVLKDSTFATLRHGSTYDSDPFYCGYGNEMILDNTDWKLDDVYLMMSKWGSNNVLRLVNGSTLTVTNKTFGIGYSSANSTGNLIYIGAGCKAEAIRLRMASLNSTITVSNGTLKVNEASNGINMAYTAQNTSASGNVLRLEGDSPVVSSAGPLTFHKSATLVVALPRDKFVKGHVPIRAPRLVFDETSRIKVEGEEFFAKTGGSVTLAEVTNSFSIPDSVITASLADMPPGCKLYVSGKKLMFRAPWAKGCWMIIR